MLFRSCLLFSSAFKLHTKSISFVFSINMDNFPTIILLIFVLLWDNLSRNLNLIWNLLNFFIFALLTKYTFACPWLSIFQWFSRETRNDISRFKLQFIIPQLFLLILYKCVLFLDFLKFLHELFWVGNPKYIFICFVIHFVFVLLDIFLPFLLINSPRNVSHVSIQGI